jgi:predicted metal-dependent peptidase
MTTATITDQAAALKMIKTRIALIMEQPFFGTLALRLRLIESRTLKTKTMAVDGVNIFYDPDFVNDRSFSDIKFVVAHEVGHCMFEHMSRRGGRQPTKWNHAGDYVINEMLVDAGFQRPDIGLFNPKFKGMTTDEVYNLLPDMPDDGKGQMDAVLDAPAGSGDGDGEGVDGSGQSPASIAEDWKIATVQAANAAKGQGKLPASLQRFVDELVRSKTDWRPRLREFFLEDARNDYSWARVNKRYASLGFYLPGLYSQEMGTVVIVTDDSGSIGDDILKAFAGEIDDIRQCGRPQRTIVLSCDARINHVDDLTMDDEFKLKCHGGGGTDFRPPFTWLEEQGIEPACLVYLTDLYGPFPDKQPPYPVLWCSINDHRAPWGETIRIEL